ncbi:MAG TPA: prephenate dehydrogenase/arogenate dehydrogenase family protein [Solimonas sp.]|nr:prephenate dehydrogenase/arogenate dehydrogenase family protein [Solimonas sp.]
MSVRRLAVIGLGLIGGSFARALREAGEVAHVSGFDPDGAQRQRALELGVVDAVFDSAAAAVRDADLVLLAVPVLHTADALRSCIGALKTGAIVSDVGSTKQSVLRDVAEVCDGLPPWFVAAHPIAGTEKSGVANSVAALFRGHRVILTPHAGQDLAARQTVAALWQAVGARVVEMDAAQHDAIFAATSHLPHVLAYSFVDMLDRLEHSGDIFPNAGGGFRDFTRIASSSPQMWHDIVRANADAVGKLLDRQIDELQQIRQMMRDARWDDMKTVFERARGVRERYLSQIE